MCFMFVNEATQINETYEDLQNFDSENLWLRLVDYFKFYRFHKKL